MSKTVLTCRKRESEDYEYFNSSDYRFGSYFSKAEKYPVLNAREEIELAKLVKEGSSDAKTMLVQCNLRLVLSIASGMLHSGNLPFADLVQEGTLGLMVAAEKFDYSLGFRFATYASWWIKQAMFKAISEQSHCMSIPVYVQETLAKFRKEKAKAELLQNESVSDNEIAEKMNMDKDKLAVYMNAFAKSMSFDGDFDDDGELSLCNIIEDKNASATSEAEYNALVNGINRLLDTLKEREKNVLIMRFGLNKPGKMTLEEIGRIYGVTKECIRQTESKALKKLRENGKSAVLFEAYVTC